MFAENQIWRRYGAFTYRHKALEGKRGHAGHDVISCQRETTWRTLCIVFVGNRTMSRNL